MTDFGRVPLLNVEETDKVEKEIFDKPKVKETKTSDEVDDKKLKLKEHLAKCRAKSVEVRKAKALEKKANKKPVGRPKRVKENVVMEVADQSEVEQSEPAQQEEIFKQEKPKVMETIIEDKVLTPPPSNNMFDMDMMLNKFDERMDQKLKAFQTPTPQPTPQPNMGIDPNVYGFVSYMKDQEEKIRNEERTKYVNELEQKKNDLLLQNNRKYFKKLPPRQFHQPVQQQQAPQENNMWDDLLNPKKRY